MTSSRFLFALLISVAMAGATALAVPPVGVPHVGGPPIGVRPLPAIPPVNAPPVSVPKPQTNVPPVNVNSHASANANVNASLMAATVMHGTLTSISGANVTVRLSNGTTQTYSVSSQTAAQLQSFLNKNIAFRVQNGTFAFAGAGTPPLHGTLVAVTGTTAQVKLANGTTQTYNLTSQQAAWLQGHVGKSVAFWSSANGTIELNQSSHRSQTAHHTTRRHSH